MPDQAPLPPKLARIVSLFNGAPKDLKLQALLEYSKKLPDLPERYASNREFLEQVHECQSPFFLAAEVTDDVVSIFFEAPPEAPTTRGYAGILHEGLDGASPDEVMAVPVDFYSAMGLDEAVSSLRLRGMSAILHRLQRQVTENR